LYANVLNAIITDIDNSQEWLFLGLRSTLLRIAAKMPTITARFLWAFPSMLSQFLIDLYIITALTMWQLCLSQKGSYEQTTSSKLVDISNRLQWCFVCGLNPASKLTKPITASEDANGLTSKGHNLDTAGDTTSMATRRDLHESQRKQQNTVSSHNCSHAMHNMMYPASDDTVLKMWYSILTHFQFKSIPVLPEVSQMTNHISNPSNLLTPMTLQEYLDQQERNHLSEAKEQSDGRLRMTMAWYTQSNWKMPCTYQHSRHVCCVLNIGVNPQTITSRLEMEHGKPPTLTTSSYIGTSSNSRGQFHGMRAWTQDTYGPP
jgi:hypothetical protein